MPPIRPAAADNDQYNDSCFYFLVWRSFNTFNTTIVQINSSFHCLRERNNESITVLF